ncbi:SCO family protein [Planctomycetota bacterium]|nr:SCO family protein [Planctomycetota bacterium]
MTQPFEDNQDKNESDKEQSANDSASESRDQTHESAHPSTPKGGIQGVQSLVVWIIAIVALGAAAVMTVDVLIGGAPGKRNVLNDTSVDGKQPLLLDAPKWQLTDAFGKTVSNDDFKGKVMIYDFIFTRCALVCPIMSMQMADIQNTLKGTTAEDKVEIVSISIDGAHDTPEVLKKYGYDPERGVGADPEMWHFVTGDQATVWPLVDKQFLLPVDEQPEVEGMPIAHSAKFVLVDKQGRIYNYYDLNEKEDRSAILADIERLINQ